MFSKAVTRGVLQQFACIAPLMETRARGETHGRFVILWGGKISEDEVRPVMDASAYGTKLGERATALVNKLDCMDVSERDKLEGPFAVMNQIVLGNYVEARRRVLRSAMSESDTDAVIRYLMTTRVGAPNTFNLDAVEWACRLADNASGRIKKALRTFMVWYGRSEHVEEVERLSGSPLTPLELDILLANRTMAARSNMDFTHDAKLIARSHADISESVQYAVAVRSLLMGTMQQFNEAFRVKKTA